VAPSSDRDESEYEVIRLSPREARLSRIANIVLSLLAFHWPGKEEGERLPDGGRLLRVDREVIRTGQFIWIALFAALAIGVYLIWRYWNLVPR